MITLHCLNITEEKEDGWDSLRPDTAALQRLSEHMFHQRLEYSSKTRYHDRCAVCVTLQHLEVQICCLEKTYSVGLINLVQFI